MNQCCTLDNMDAATATGKANSKLNCLTCRTCDTQQSFVYPSEDDMNLCWSYVQLGVERSKRNLLVVNLAPKIPKQIEPPKPRPDASHAEKMLSLLDRSMLDG